MHTMLGDDNTWNPAERGNRDTEQGRAGKGNMKQVGLELPDKPVQLPWCAAGDGGFSGRRGAQNTGVSETASGSALEFAPARPCNHCAPEPARQSGGFSHRER